MLRKITASLLAVLLLAASITVNGIFQGGAIKVAAADTDIFDDLSQDEIVLDMGAGWNLGNQMEGNNNGTPSETAWCSTKVTAALLQAVADAGFKTVRIPCSYLSKIGSAPDYTINSAWLNRINEVVDYAIDAGLYVIINVHGDGYHTVTGGWLLVDAEDQDTIRAKYEKVWEQIATKFKDYDEHLIFESMNEVFDGTYSTPPAASYANLNTLNQIFVDTVRQTGGNNAKRWLLVPGWNTNIDYTVGSYGFEIPTDNYRDSSVSENRLMISVHYYDPWEFALREDTIVTQWGSIATNSSKVASWGGESYMKSQIKKLYTTFTSKGYPVIIGEYGTVDKDNDTYRAYYAKMLCTYAKQYGCVPVLWDNAWNGDYGMGVFNRSTKTVTQQGIIDAIMSVYDAPTTALTLSSETLYFGEAGQSAELIASPTPTYTNDTLKWSTSDSSVATVSKGVVTAVGGGTCVITATSGSVSAQCTVSVRVPATGIEFAQQSYIVALGDSFTPVVNTLPANSTDEITYVLKSSDSSVISVSDMTVQGCALGEAVLVASSTDFVANATVTVTTEPQSISLSYSSIELEKRDTAALPEVTVTPEDSAFPIVWTSSDDSVAYIENGYICAASRGTVTLTASFGKLSADCVVTVTDPFPDTVPTMTAKSGGYDRAKISWDAVDDAVSYEIWCSTSASSGFAKAATVSDVTTYTHTGRTCNKTYYYKIRAINEYGEYTQYSEVASVKIVPAAPATVKAARASYNSIKVSWSKVSGASGYVIYRATSENGTYKAIKTITKGTTTSFTNTGLTCGKTYYYKVKAYRTISGKKIYGTSSVAFSAKPYLSKTSSISVTRSSYGLLIKWKKVTGATGYKIYRATDPDGEYTLIKTITKGSTVKYTNTSVVPGVTYYYKVTATRSGSEGVVSAVKSLSPALAKPTSPKAARYAYNKIKLTWKKVSGASGYVIFRSDSASGTYTEVGRVSGNTTVSYIDTDLATGKTYYYKIAAYRTAGGLTGIGTKTSYVSAKTTMGYPGSFAAARSSYDSIKLTWKAPGGADGYYVYRATSKNGTYSQLAKIEDGTVLTYTDDNLITGKYYYYKVRAYHIEDGTEVLSSYTAYKYARGTLSTPKITVKKTAAGTATITVTPVDGADGYVIYRATSKNGTYTNVTSKCTQTTDESGNLVFTYAGQTKNKTYYYKVRAYHTESSGNVFSEYSSYKSLKV